VQRDATGRRQNRMRPTTVGWPSLLKGEPQDELNKVAEISLANGSLIFLKDYIAHQYTALDQLGTRLVFKSKEIHSRQSFLDK
jgi:hypothetical protein